MEKPKKIESNYMRRVKPQKAKPEKFDSAARDRKQKLDDIMERRKLEQDLAFF